MSILELIMVAVFIFTILMILYIVTEKWLDIRAMKDHEEWLHEREELEKKMRDHANG